MNFADSIKNRLQPVWKAFHARLCALPPKRFAVVAAAVFLSLGMVRIPASGILRPVQEGEVFGEIHWYVRAE